MTVWGWLGVFVVAPVLTFLHELAHAGAGLFAQPGRLWIKLGSGERRRSVRLGRIDIHLHTPFWYATGHMGYGQTRPGRIGEAAVSMAGPVASLAMGLALLRWHWTTELTGAAEVLVVAGYNWALIQALLTGVPMTYPAGMPGYGGRPSDGLRLVRQLRLLRASGQGSND